MAQVLETHQGPWSTAWAKFWRYVSRVLQTYKTLCVIWSNGWDSNSRFLGFAIPCVGPLRHRCIAWSPMQESNLRSMVPNHEWYHFTNRSKKLDRKHKGLTSDTCPTGITCCLKRVLAFYQLQHIVQIACSLASSSSSLSSIDATSCWPTVLDLPALWRHNSIKLHIPKKLRHSRQSLFFFQLNGAACENRTRDFSLEG